MTAGDPPCFSRRWLGEVFVSTLGLLFLLKIASDVFDWRSGLGYWLIAGPILAANLAAGVCWLALAVRGGLRRLRRV